MRDERDEIKEMRDKWNQSDYEKNLMQKKHDFVKQDKRKIKVYLQSALNKHELFKQYDFWESMLY